MTEVSRRQVVVVAALGAAGLTVAGCSGGGDKAEGSGTSAPSGAAGTPAASGQEIVSTADVPVQGGVIVDAGETKVVVTQPTEGDFVGLSAVCPHQNCLVNQVSDQKIICPCHGSEFSITDGAVIQGPATTGLSPVQISVDGDRVVLG